MVFKLLWILLILRPSEISASFNGHSPFSFCAVTATQDEVELDCHLTLRINKFNFAHFYQWVQRYLSNVKNLKVTLKCNDDRAIVEMPWALGIPILISIDIEGCFITKLNQLTSEFVGARDQRKELKLRHCRVLVDNLFDENGSCDFNSSYKVFMTELLIMQMSNITLVTQNGDSIPDSTVNSCFISLIATKQKYEKLKTLDLSLNSYIINTDFKVELNALQVLNLSGTMVNGKNIEIFKYNQLKILDLSRSPTNDIPSFENRNRIVNLQINLSRTKLKSLHEVITKIYDMINNPLVTLNFIGNVIECQCPEHERYVETVQILLPEHPHLRYLDDLICNTTSGNYPLTKIVSLNEYCQTQFAGIQIALCFVALTLAVLVLFIIRCAYRCMEAAQRKAVMETIHLIEKCSGVEDTRDAFFWVFISFHYKDWNSYIK